MIDITHFPENDKPFDKEERETVNIVMSCGTARKLSQQVQAWKMPLI